MTKVALFADRGSVRSAEIAACVTAEGGKPVVLDIQLGGLQRPEDNASGGVAATLSSGTLRWQGIDVEGIRAVHVRCTAPRVLPALPAVLTSPAHGAYRTALLREQEFNAATWSFLEEMAARGAVVVNPLTAWIEHDSKGQLHEKLQEWGFSTPPTLSTSDPERLRAFITEVGRVVVKPAVGIGSTRVVGESDLSRLDEVLLCPALFQSFIEGETIRVHMVGETIVLALRVLSDGHMDSRTHVKGFEYVELPAVEQANLVAAGRRLGLHYAAWDIIRDRAGRIYYLDCNPGPSLMWIDSDHRRIVMRQLARYLVCHARGKTLAEALAGVDAWRPSHRLQAAPQAQ
ncbi:MAG: hypothetical protein FD142_3143 [bacterium]|nr:MAG: hypothetical protein FD142_3143 [bacterium]